MVKCEKSIVLFLLYTCSCLIRYGGSLAKQSCMSVRINSTGDRVIGLRRRLPPVLFHLNSPTTMHQFDHSGYYNSCTMKSCCFAGDKDQVSASGATSQSVYDTNRNHLVDLQSSNLLKLIDQI